MRQFCPLSRSPAFPSRSSVCGNVMIIGCTNRDSCVDTALFELWPRTWTEIESWKMRQSVLFDNKRMWGKLWQRKANKIEGTVFLCFYAAWLKAAALITPNWPATNNVTTVKCNIKIFLTFILGLSFSLGLCLQLYWPDRQMPKKRKMATKWNLPAAHSAATTTTTATTEHRKGNNFHKAKHLLYLPNGVWKQAGN